MLTKEILCSLQKDSWNMDQIPNYLAVLSDGMTRGLFDGLKELYRLLYSRFGIDVIGIGIGDRGSWKAISKQNTN